MQIDTRANNVRNAPTAPQPASKNIQKAAETRDGQGNAGDGQLPASASCDHPLPEPDPGLSPSATDEWTGHNVDIAA
jgi:hypothetical protein